MVLCIPGREVMLGMETSFRIDESSDRNRHALLGVTGRVQREGLGLV